jgi:hypothetical protein
MQVECLHFEAYVHVCTIIMWRVMFQELRGLTNSKGLELSPLELNTLYEYLYDLGLKLQTGESMVVFEEGFRPWPHVWKGRGRSKKFYSRIDANLTQDLDRIRSFNERDDTQKYCVILRDVLNCFGIGIIDSLEYTMKHYIKQTAGKLCNDNRDVWEKEAVQKWFRTTTTLNDLLQLSRRLHACIRHHHFKTCQH